MKFFTPYVSAFAVVAALACCTEVRAQIVERPVPGDPIALDTGKVAGKLLDSGVRGYFGVPYAAAPTRRVALA